VLNDYGPGPSAAGDPGARSGVPRSAIAVVVALAAGAIVMLTGLRGCSEPASGIAPIAAPAPVSSAEFAKLTRSTTYTTVAAASPDPDPFAGTDGTVLHPTTDQVLYAAPGGKAIAVLPSTQLGGPTWVPVVESDPGWDRVLLPSRPNRGTGWLYTGGTAAAEQQTRHTAYTINIEVNARKLTVQDAGKSVGTWTVAVGAPNTPTPTGRTFILALLAPPHPTYSPLILPLGAHSNVFSTFGGGPGTVGIHGWPDPSVFGQAVSNGCVRVPSDALTLISRIPLGTLVTITQ
jgi:lipoprotein-anchoring transpeptidase ErfK/SrfK